MAEAGDFKNTAPGSQQGAAGEPEPPADADTGQSTAEARAPQAEGPPAVGGRF